MARPRQPKSAIMPRDTEAPTGTLALQTEANRRFRVAVRAVLKGWKNILAQIPVRIAVNARYEFQLDQYSLSHWLENGNALTDEILLEGGEDSWFFRSFVSPAYSRGTAQEFANLSRQSPVYHAGRESVASLLNSDVYQRRLMLTRARVFEEMKGFSGSVKADMARTLTDGLARGQNPLDIAKSLTRQSGVDERRAERIARTEITTALRRARLDEAEDAIEEYDLESKQMHVSALTATTRKTHWDRHGTLHTIEEQRDFMAVDGNSINCQCSSITVMVDSEGKPLVDAIVQRAKANKAKMALRYPDK